MRPGHHTPTIAVDGLAMAETDDLATGDQCVGAAEAAGAKAPEAGSRATTAEARECLADGSEDFPALSANGKAALSAEAG